MSDEDGAGGRGRPEPERNVGPAATDVEQSRSAPRTSTGKEGQSRPVREPHPAGSDQTGEPGELERAESFDWAGWVLVAVVICSFLVVPGLVLFLPEMHGFISRLGFSLRQAYLVFPMIPAILLGLTAIWATLRSYSAE